RGSAVVVTINYRLGVLGWAAHPELMDPITGTAANWALQDQTAALQWVRDNIAAFGGDPANIIVMGQSGGAINAVMLMQSDRFDVPIAKLILLSAPYIAPPSMANTNDA